jgi:ATP-dependent Lon protease
MDKETKTYFDRKFKGLESRLEQKLEDKLGKKFDEKLKNFATKDDLIALEDRLDKKFASKDDLSALEKRMQTTFATKDDLTAQTAELKTFSEEQTGELVRIIATSIAEPLERVQRKLNNPFARQM